MLYNFHNCLTVELDHRTPFGAFFAAEFDTFASSSQGSGSRLVVEVDDGLHLNHIPSPVVLERTLCQSDGNYYLVDLDGRLCTWLDPRSRETQVVVRAHPSFKPFRLYWYILLPFLKQCLNAIEMTFIHASGVAVGGKGLVFSAWGGTGKTNVILHLIERRGAIYFGDDLVIVDASGRMYPFPRRLNTYHYNLRASEALRRMSGFRRRVTAAFAEQTANALSRVAPQFTGPLSVASKKVTVMRVSASDLGGSVATAPIDAQRLYLLLPEGQGNIAAREQSSTGIMWSLLANLQYEFLPVDRIRMRQAFLAGASTESVVNETDGGIIDAFLRKVPASVVRLGAMSLDETIARLLTGK